VDEIHRFRRASPDDVRLSGKDIRIPPKYFMALHELMCRLEEGSSAMTNSEFMIHTFLVVRTIVFGEVDTEMSYKDMLNGWDDKTGFLAEASLLMSKIQDLSGLSMEDRLKVLQGAVLLWSSELSAKEFRAMIGLLVRALYCADLTVRTRSRTLCEGNEFYAAIMGRTQFYEGLVSLEAKGAIKKHTIHVRKSDHLTVNLGWNKPIAARFRGLGLKRKALINAVDGLCEKGYYQRTNTGKGAFSIRRTVEGGLNFPPLYRTEGCLSAPIVDSKVQNNVSIDQEWPVAASSPAAQPVPHHKASLFEEKSPKKNSKFQKGQNKIVGELSEVVRAVGFPTHELEGVPSAAVVELRTKHEGRVSLDQLERRWNDTMRNHPYFEAPIRKTTFNSKQREKVAARMKEHRRNGMPFPDFIDWCLINWRQVTSRYFGWANGNIPEAPNVDWLMAPHTLDQFASVCASKELGQLWKTKRTDDEAEVRRLMKIGSTREEAILRIAERKARSGMRDEIAKGQHNVSQ